ncbi:MAG: ribonuclease HI [Roseibium sp.]|uniref:ribonuclease HI n=1 Tax=Roseibium sp. TaxID=1936156 RepID=UPI00329812D3
MTHQIYTDGSCLRNPEGPGGWAFVVVGPDGAEVARGAGGETPTTNNRMELTAAVQALRATTKLPEGSKVTIISDSKYVVEGITQWIKGWKNRKWRTANKTPVKNDDLWRTLDELNAKMNVTWKWVKGHDGNHWNEVVDQLAVAESTRLDMGR